MGEGLLRVREAASAAEEAEQPEVLSVAELEERFERGGDEGAKLLRRARKLSILSPVGKDLFSVPSPSLLAAADEAQGLGIPVEHTVDAIAEVERHATAVARRFVKLFLDDVWKPFAKEGMPEDQWPAIVDAMERTRRRPRVPSLRSSGERWAASRRGSGRHREEIVGGQALAGKGRQWIHRTRPRSTGEELVTAGTSPYQLFAIEEGSLEVRRDGERLATLGAGEVVGERGIVEQGLRNASAVATDHPEVEQRREILAERGG